MLSKRAQRSIESEIKRMLANKTKLENEITGLDNLNKEIAKQIDRLKALLEPKAEG